MRMIIGMDRQYPQWSCTGRNPIFIDVLTTAWINFDRDGEGSKKTKVPSRFVGCFFFFPGHRLCYARRCLEGGV